jgi:hypothetical protein
VKGERSDDELAGPGEPGDGLGLDAEIVPVRHDLALLEDGEAFARDHLGRVGRGCRQAEGGQRRDDVGQQVAAVAHGQFAHVLPRVAGKGGRRRVVFDVRGDVLHPCEGEIRLAQGLA